MKFVEFLKDPSTKDERSVAKVLEKYAVAVISRDTETLKSLITENAMIKSDAVDEKLFLERDEFIRRASKIVDYLFFYSFINIIIKATEDTAVVSCSAYWWLLNNRPPKMVPLQFGFIKKNDAWFISNIEYIRDMTTSFNDLTEAPPDH